MGLFLLALLVAVVSAGHIAPRCRVSKSNSTLSSPPPTTTGKTPDSIAATWFAGYHAAGSNPSFPVSSINWTQYNHISYGFATTTPDVNALSITSSDETIIPQMVSAAHSHGASASISVGGWGGSRYFSTAVATAENRTMFVKTLSDFVAKWQFDGIDFDWEYPGKLGVECNTISPSDTANFLLLLQELRSTPATSNLTMSAATSITPWVDASGQPSTDVTPFAKVLDFIEIMNYDIWGSWSTSVGPNAPLDDSCAPTIDQQGSAKSAVAAWTKAGMPSSKIVMGVAGYGHSFSVPAASAVQNNELTSFPPFDKANQPPGDSWAGTAGVDVCGQQQAAGGTYNFWGLIQAGFLTAAGSPASGIKYRFDNCSQTAYVYDSTNSAEISFDDATAFAAKGNYIKSASLRGFSLWEAGSDKNGILVNAILGALN